MRLGMSSLFVSLAATLLFGAGAQAQVAAWHGHPPGRRWHHRHHRPVGPGRLINQARGLCLDIVGRNRRGPANVQIWRCNGDPDQVWSFAPSGELIDAASGLALDAAGLDGRKGANVGVYRTQHMADQRWSLVPRGNGTFELHNEARGMCLDVKGHAGQAGGNVMLWACDGGADQRWSWQPAGAPPPRVVVRAPPVMHPMPPPPAMRPMPPRGRAMGKHRFQKLMGAVRAATFSSDKLAVVRSACDTNYFRAKQAKQIISALTFSKDKLNALRALAPRIVDRGNAFEIPAAFTFSTDKQKAREILKHAGM